VGILRGRVVAVSLLLAVFVLMGVGARTGRADESNASHPAGIRAGTCDNLGDVVAPLSDVGASFTVDGAPSAAQPIGSPSANPVEASETTVQMALRDLVNRGTAIEVRLSAEDTGEFIACGDIGGTMMGAGSLPIGLAERNNSGYSGVAWLHDDGNGTTTVYVFLTKQPEPAAGGTTSASENVAVTLNDFTVTPSQTTLKVGVPYTFTITNDGKAQHELVLEKATDVDVPLQASGHEAEAEAIDPGTSKTLEWTFTAPGEYQLACHVPGHFEAGMFVKIEVTS
jgi:uncharacterized cupredoxin-like copper-binding protein